MGWRTILRLLIAKFFGRLLRELPLGISGLVKRWRVLSVPRRLLYVIDHERFDRPFRRFEFQAELSLDRSEYRVRWFGCRGAAVGGLRRPKRGKPGSLSRELNTNIELTCDSGLVEYRAA